MKSVFYTITINKRRYVACVEMGSMIIAVSHTPITPYHRIQDGRVFGNFATIGEAMYGKA